MKRHLMIAGMIVIWVTALAACNPNEPEASTSCPTPQSGTTLLTYEAQGYCLLYPETHQPVEVSEAETVFVVGDLMNVSEPRVSVNVTDAAGESTTDAAGRILAVFGLPDSNPPGAVTMGGMEAVVLDNMPGQDINRRVIMVHNDRLYDLTFLPIGPDYGDVGQRTEELYQLVIDSFTFTP
jgi:hypothetical protein